MGKCLTKRQDKDQMLSSWNMQESIKHLPKRGNHISKWKVGREVTQREDSKTAYLVCLIVLGLLNMKRQTKHCKRRERKHTGGN